MSHKRSHFIPGAEYIAVRRFHNRFTDGDKGVNVGDVVDAPWLAMRGFYGSLMVGLKGDGWTNAMLAKHGIVQEGDKPVDSTESERRTGFFARKKKSKKKN